MSLYALRCLKCNYLFDKICNYSDLEYQLCPQCKGNTIQDYASKNINSGIPRTVGTLAEQITRQKRGL
jgi:phage FluMu protein Com